MPSESILKVVLVFAKCCGGATVKTSDFGPKQFPTGDPVLPDGQHEGAPTIGPAAPRVGGRTQQGRIHRL